MRIFESGRTSAAAFALIEPAVTSAIAAVPAPIALPAHSNYTRKAKIQDAFTYLPTLNLKQQLC